MTKKSQKACPSPYTVYIGTIILLSRALSLKTDQAPLLIQFVGSFSIDEVVGMLVGNGYSKSLVSGGIGGGPGVKSHGPSLLASGYDKFWRALPNLAGDH